jgi:hypothetical protein
VARLQPLLERRKDTDPLAVEQVPQLAEETLRQGVSVLVDALELAQAVQSTERERLRLEVRELEAEIAAIEGNEREAARVVLKKDTLASHRERLEIMDQNGIKVEELLHQGERCEASLGRARMDLAAMKVENAATGLTSVTETLRRTIEQARSVQQELRALGL